MFKTGNLFKVGNAAKLLPKRIRRILKVNFIQPKPPLKVFTPSTPLETYDNGKFPVHRRGISVQKPEVLGSFDFRPIFGDSYSQLTPEGKFIDTQINARKIRINDIRTLFEGLLEKEGEPVADLANTLMEQLEAEYQKAERDIGTVTRIMDTIFSFIASLNLKRLPERMKRRQVELRNIRIEKNPIIRALLDEPLTFPNMLKEHHGFSDTSVSQFSNTKLMLYQIADLKQALKGPIKKINSRESIPGFPEDPVEFKVGNEVDTNFIAENLVEVFHPYNLGVISTKRTAQPNYNANMSYELNSSPKSYNPAPAQIAKSCAKTCMAITQDFALSSAIANNDFMRAFLEDFPSQSNSIPEVLFGPLPVRSSNIFSSRGLTNDKSFLSTILYKNENSEPITPIFDPDIATYEFTNLEENSGKFEGPIQKFVDPLLKSVESEEIDVTQLRQLGLDLPTRLRSIAQGVDFLLALDKPAMTPEAMLKDILGVFDKLIGELGSNPVPGGNPEGWARRPLELEILCLLSEAHLNSDQHMSFDIGGQTTRADTVRADYINMHSLLSLLLVTSVKNENLPGDHFLDLVTGAELVDQEDDQNWVSEVANEIPAAMLNTLNRALPNYHRMQYSDGYSLGKRDVLPGSTKVEDVVGKKFIATDYVKRWTRFRYIWANLERFNSPSGTSWRGGVREGGTTEISPNFFYGYNDGLEDNTGGYQHTRTVGSRLFQGEGSGAGSSPNFRFIESAPNRPFQLQDASVFYNKIKDMIDNPTYTPFVIGFVGVLDKLMTAATARGAVVGVHPDGGGKMLSSGVDAGAIVSMILNIFSLIADKLCTTQFFTLNSQYHGVESRYNGARFGEGSQPATMKVGIEVQDYRKLSKFSVDVKAYLEGGVEAIDSEHSELRAFINEFNEFVNAARAPVVEFVDFCNALASQIEDSSQALMSAFEDKNENQNTEGVQELRQSIGRVAPSLPDLMNFPQVVLSKNRMETYTKREGYSRYFDNFLVDPADENFFYAALRDKKFSFPDGDNMSILCVGIPQGFTENVLKINGVSQPSEFQDERKVDIVVRKTDLILGDRAKCLEKTYTFDLNVFFDSFIDPITSNPDTRTPRITDPNSGNPDYYREITDREYPERAQVINENIMFRRFNLDGRDFETFKGSDDALAGNVFENHVNDKLAKIYIRLAYGCDISANKMFIDTSYDAGLPTEEELRMFENLIGSQIQNITGKDLNIDDFLAKDRKNRELYSRLTKEKEQHL